MRLSFDYTDRNTEGAANYYCKHLFWGSKKKAAGKT